MPADDPMYERALELLNRFGAVSVEHPSGTLLEHLRGTYEQLERWGCSEDLCRAGLYHSVYGTEYFQKRTVPLDARDEVRSAIGERAEEIAYLYCALSRQSLYRKIYERAVPLLPGVAVAEFREMFPRRGKAELLAARLLRAPRRALRLITKRLGR